MHQENLSYISAVVTTAVLLVACSYFVIQRAYPRPLAGIPYNQASAKRLFGDGPELAEYTQKGRSLRTWFVDQAERHNSAITQIFLGPFSSPAVVVSDYREVNDILSHRDGVDFKRGTKVDAFRGVIPHAFPAMETFDPEFRGSRNIARDLMTPSVLHAVNAPRIYDVACHLLDLWGVKSRLAGGRPFDVSNDVGEFAFDAVVSAAFGLGPQGGDIKYQHEQLAKLACNNDSSSISKADHDTDFPISFPAAPRSAKLDSLRIDEESLRQSFMVPWPRLYHFFNSLRPSVRAARRILRGYVASQIIKAVPGLRDGTQNPQCALDYVIQRELRAAATAGRTPALADPRILDPIYAYLIAGHDTTMASLLWLIRRLVAHPAEQDRLRESLKVTYPEAWRERRLPTVAELIKVHSPYMEAFIEETLRCDTPVVNVLVVTRHDTIVLGHRLPRDTRVFLSLTGASLTRPSIPVAEADRRATSGAYSTVSRDNWDAAAPEEFRPERWLKESRGTMPVFDASAGPGLAFSAGNRGCWGKRLGYLELRIVLALLVWRFVFGISDKFSSWEPIDSLAISPKHCIIKIREISYE
ncbi:cytochrome P450 [Nemania sp. NC0429]|nr:cytochrome P450 [Nemania sp. NC0429]